MRLIDADICLSKLKPHSLEDEEWYLTCGIVKRLIHDAINNTPIIDPLDALGICRCKDCIHLSYNNENEPYCNNRYGLSDPKETDYCPYAKRKGNSNETN